VAAGAAAATLLAKAPSVMAQPKIQWRMSTAWPKQLDVMQGLAERLGTVVQEMSGGRFRIEVFPGGQIMKAFECFDETSKGTIECFMGTASYWAPDRDAALQWFMSIPFGMDPQGMASWYYQGDGRKLMEETYAPYNVVPRLGPAFAPQMGAGSRRRSTRSATTRDSGCVSPASAGWSSPRPEAAPSSRPPATSSARSSAG
jgi:TRAP-type mannitol/chloroaromatic compound transport system substrate-binding protein